MDPGHSDPAGLVSEASGRGPGNRDVAPAYASGRTTSYSSTVNRRQRRDEAVIHLERSIRRSHEEVVWHSLGGAPNSVCFRLRLRESTRTCRGGRVGCLLFQPLQAARLPLQ